MSGASLWLAAPASPLTNVSSRVARAMMARLRETCFMVRSSWWLGSCELPGKAAARERLDRDGQAEERHHSRGHQRQPARDQRTALVQPRDEASGVHDQQSDRKRVV